MTKGYINITDVKEFHKQIMNPQMERMKFMKKFKYFLLTGMLLDPDDAEDVENTDN